MTGHGRTILIGTLAVLAGAASGAIDATSGLFPLDLASLGAAADRLLSAEWRSTFAVSDIQVGPLYLATLGLLRGLARALDLSHRVVLAVAVQGVCALGFVATVRHVLGRSDPLLEGGAALAAILGGVGWTAYISGHPEELAVGMLWIWVGVAALRSEGSSWLPGLLLAAAAALKLSGVLGLPLLLLLPTTRARLIGVGAFVAGCALAYGPFLALGEVRTFDYRWPVDNELWSLLVEGPTFPWWMRVLQGTVVVAVGATVVTWLRGSRVVVWAAPLALAAARVVTDPQPHHYFWLSYEGAAIIGAAVVIGAAGPLQGLAAAASAYAAMVSRYLPFVPGLGLRVIAGAALVGMARTASGTQAVLDPTPSGGLGAGGKEAIAGPRRPL